MTSKSIGLDVHKDTIAVAVADGDGAREVRFHGTIRRGVFPTVETLEAAIRRYLEATKAEPHPFVWTKSADDILDSVRRFCERTNDVHKRQETSNSTH